MATKKGSKKGTSKKGAKGSSKRDLVKGRSATFYAKRESGGEFSEMDEQKKSLRADVRKQAKKKVKPGYGDQGDQKKTRTSGSKKKNGTHTGPPGAKGRKR